MLDISRKTDWIYNELQFEKVKLGFLLKFYTNSNQVQGLIHEGHAFSTDP